MKTSMVSSVISAKKDSTTSPPAKVAIVTPLVSWRPSKVADPCQLVNSVSAKNESKGEFVTNVNHVTGIYNLTIQMAVKNVSATYLELLEASENVIQRLVSVSVNLESQREAVLDVLMELTIYRKAISLAVLIVLATSVDPSVPSVTKKVASVLAKLE